ncbi:MAG: flagellar protein export ATPase FliI [Thauera propionica]|jgi:flagellum-specific ATP synthase|uniref:Flagellum-specific ATP synthase n=1 Tax=Thauera propionica TaxID=2019431 RepID=A0A235EWE4_9RHOO|nr:MULTISPECIES: flagellar protein export ATPase FliI [Thauera]MDI3490865.1 flagellum-specific synthase [Thauera sp.]MDY0047845.1 flagellar protein export ATPase FliI [Thauera propionica]OYD53366.1 flagellar protein export ATPase FliI [Thauera propionica]
MKHGGELWRGFLSDGRRLVENASAFEISGRLTRINGLVMEAAGLKLPLGSGCRVLVPGGGAVEAEVVGFNGDKLFMMPTDDVFGLAPGARVLPMEVGVPRLVPGKRIGPRRRAADRAKHLPVGDALLGRVVDGAGRPLDGAGPLTTQETRSLQGRPINPLARAPISQPLDVGIRAINALLTVGRGQRLGLFAGSGVGKSVLIGMMARYTEADIIVVGLIGERGREVKEFIDHSLGPEGLARSVVVAAPADTSPLMRMQGAAYATTIAEYFRDQGKQVLLIMDSLTRYAMAQREIALAIGEPPVTRGYPPSVFARLPALVERAGNGPEGGGSITAFYTVLAEGDDQQDPIADSARAILDGHFVLSRSLADQGHYPALDIEQSISRAMHNLVGDDHFAVVRQFKQFFSRYQRSRDLIAVGAYQAGGDPVLDTAVRLYPRLEAFLQQGINECEPYDSALQKLAQVFSGGA